MSPVCVLLESSCFLLLIHTRARGYLLTLKCLRVSFRDAVRHEAEGRAACSKMVSEKNIGRMRLNAVDIARRGLQLQVTVCGTTTNATNTNSTKMKSLLLGDIRSKSIVPGTTSKHYFGQLRSFQLASGTMDATTGIGAIFLSERRSLPFLMVHTFI